MKLKREIVLAVATGMLTAGEAPELVPDQDWDAIDVFLDQMAVGRQPELRVH